MAATIRADASSSAQRTGGALDGVPEHLERRGSGHDVADPDDAGVDVHTERCDQRPAHGSGRDPRGGFASARALEDVARIAEPVLQHARQVGMAGTDAGDRVSI